MEKKASITLKSPIFTKNKTYTSDIIKKLYDICISKTDFKVVFQLIAKGQVKFDEDPFIESLVHRIGKIVDIDYVENL
jgi:hypothetical protein